MCLKCVEDTGFRRWQRPRGVISGVGRQSEGWQTLTSPHIMTPSCAPLSVYIRGVPPLVRLLLEMSDFPQRSVSVYLFICLLCFSRCSSPLSSLSLRLIFNPSHALSPSSPIPSLLSLTQIHVFSCKYIFLSLGRSTPAARPRRFLSRICTPS